MAVDLLALEQISVVIKPPALCRVPLSHSRALPPTLGDEMPPGGALNGTKLSTRTHHVRKNIKTPRMRLCELCFPTCRPFIPFRRFQSLPNSLLGSRPSSLTIFVTNPYHTPTSPTPYSFPNLSSFFHLFSSSSPYLSKSSIHCQFHHHSFQTDCESHLRHFDIYLAPFLDLLVTVKFFCLI